MWALAVSNHHALHDLATRLLDVPASFVALLTETSFGRARYTWAELCAAVAEVDIEADCAGKHLCEVTVRHETLRLGSLQGLFANALREIARYVLDQDPQPAFAFIATVVQLMNHQFERFGTTARVLIQWVDKRTVANVKVENRFGDPFQKYTGEKRHLTEKQKATGSLEGRWRRLSRQGGLPE